MKKLQETVHGVELLDIIIQLQEYSPNNSTNIAKYLYSRKPVCCTGWRAHTETVHTLLLFVNKFIDYSSWIINLLLDVLVCSVAVHFYLMFASRLKYSTTRKNIQQYYTPKHLNIRFI